MEDDPKLYVFSRAPAPTLPIAGSDRRFPVNRIFCVGRNYAAHAREMGQDDREPPFFFMKHASGVVEANETGVDLPYPPMTANFHHEIELVAALGTGGENISAENAPSHVFGYAIGLDMTRRDLQFQARDKGRPWEFGKSFLHSAPIGPIHRAAAVGHFPRAAISLTVNGVARQSGDVSQMTWSVAEAIAYLSRYEPLQAGDLIMTGTPEGVAAVTRGDVLVGRIEGLGEIRVRVV